VSSHAPLVQIRRDLIRGQFSYVAFILRISPALPPTDILSVRLPIPALCSKTISASTVRIDRGEAMPVAASMPKQTTPLDSADNSVPRPHIMVGQGTHC
jgi:hypothetical protein